MNIQQLVLGLVFSVASSAALAAPSGLALQPVLAVTQTGNGVTTIIGNMPLPDDVPGDKKQRNQVIYPTAADTLGCANLANQAKSSGKQFVIIGEVSAIYADHGVFTLEMTSLSSCKVY